MTTESQTHAGTETETNAASASARPTQQPLDLEAVRAQARAEALAYVAEVNDLCLLARMPDKAAAFIAKAVPTAEIRKALLSAQAAVSEATSITGHLPSNAVGSSASEPKIDAAAIYAARNAQPGKTTKEK